MDFVETISEQVDETLLKKYQAQLSGLQNNTYSYEAADPETVIFHKKQLLAKRLLEISVLDLSTASKQPWYGEYIALLSICLENPALCFLGKQYVAELMQWYNERIKNLERELAVLGMIQFINPLELTIPFNQDLWHNTLRDDVRAVFSNQFPSVSYNDDEISTYWLSRQAKWRHEKRKLRVIFLVQSHVTCDKVLPVYEAMKERDDIEPFLVVPAKADYTYNSKTWSYFHDRYPNDNIYYSTTLMDIRRLRPDYVFFSTPYEERRPFPSFRVSDIIQFAKICLITYGANLIYSFTNRLFDDYSFFYNNVYLMFASTQSAKKIMAEKLPKNLNLNFQHTEFFGYPALKAYYNMKAEPSSAKRILWTPRWVPKQKNEAKLGGSHFMEYKDNFVSLRTRYGDKVELFFRPHMNLFHALLKLEIMSKEEITAYRKSLKDNKIVRHTSLADMDDSIRNIDIFLTDYSSILVCLFLTGRPIIYCEFPNALPLPEYKDMFEAMYIAHNWEEVEHYLDELIAGNDPMFEKRQAIAKKIYETHKDATEKIIDRIVKDFNDTQLIYS